MYVCICNSITESQIQECLESGAESFNDLQARLGVASNCGQCACAAEQLVADGDRNLTAAGSAA